MTRTRGAAAAALAISLFTLTAPARADFLTGQQLLTFCHSTSDMQKTICSAYTVGAADMLTDLGSMLSHVVPACVPHGTSSVALVRAIEARAAAHPEETKHSASALVYTALASTWPCTSGKSP